jgi:hypothetical protein
VYRGNVVRVELDPRSSYSQRQDTFLMCVPISPCVFLFPRWWFVTHSLSTCNVYIFIYDGCQWCVFTYFNDIHTLFPVNALRLTHGTIFFYMEWKLYHVVILEVRKKMNIVHTTEGKGRNKPWRDSIIIKLDYFCWYHDFSVLIGLNIVLNTCYTPAGATGNWLLIWYGRVPSIWSPWLLDRAQQAP